jgi:hypothetical protein
VYGDEAVAGGRTFGGVRQGNRDDVHRVTLDD